MHVHDRNRHAMPCLLAATAVFGAGNGFGITPLVTVAMSALKREGVSPASALLNVLRQTGPVLGGAIVGLLIQALPRANTTKILWDS